MKLNDLFLENISSYRKLLKTKWNLPKDIKKFLENNNYRQIGGGSFSLVYTSPNSNLVVKIVDPNGDKGDCFPKFVKFVQARKNNPHLPKIGKLRWFENQDDFFAHDLFYSVLIEKLEKIPQIPSDLLQIASHIVTNTPLPSNLENKLQHYPKLLINTIKEISEVFDGLCDMDFRRDNFMKRKNGTIVITDPVSYQNYDVSDS